ncbi:MAG TPA: pyridoxamine 5'-phosphate oxidase family protein [Novosphingobium sp.]|nr:pyridoxamine 5'-phosphate oxidase family protein [Novosphingobium sp.]HZV08955.1 pyridoxamine 5'-phosphate oxidase family protein [Novosphingobium sp.]
MSQVVFPQTPAHAGRLDAAGAPDHPLALVRAWYDHVLAIGAEQPAYVTFATSSVAGVPSSRTVQMLEVEAGALLFTTNFGSRKGLEMLATGRAAVSIYWRETAQSINLTGTIDIAGEAECDRRFAEEDRAVMAARTVSFHGRPLVDEGAQLAAFHALLESDAPIARPDYWKWFRLLPDAVTFWEGCPGALNRRLHYALEGARWQRGAIEA